LEDVADEIVCARAPEFFSAVGQWYVDFSQTTDQEVRDLLHEAARTASTR
jgi:putative phosphoribosyl transferase